MYCTTVKAVEYELTYYFEDDLNTLMTLKHQQTGTFTDQ